MKRPPMMATARTMTKPYNIILTGANDAEVDLYGEVVESRPVDWWTGEPIPGNFIAVDEFLSDIADLDTKDNVTFHINSVGGDLYAGISIYNRIRNMKANVTTVIDGLAASAGSLIFSAGKTRKVTESSTMMIHGASCFVYGYYNSREMKDVVKQIDAGTKAVAKALAEASGNDYDTVKSWVDKETWYTGQEIIDAGFADELTDEGVPLTMSLSNDKAFLFANGLPLSTYGMKHIPANIPVMPPEAQPTTATADNSAAGTLHPTQMSVANNTTVTPEGDPVTPLDNTTNNAGGNSIMANQNPITTLDELRAAYPELTAQLVNSATAAERARIQSIDGIRNAIGNPTLVNEAMFGENPLTAEQLALRAMQEQAAIGANMMTAMRNDAAASGAAGVQADPVGSDPAEDPKNDDKTKVDEVVNLFKQMNGRV